MAAGLMTKFWARRSKRVVSSSGSTAHPMRQPVIEKYLLNELMTMALSDSDVAVTDWVSP